MHELSKLIFDKYQVRKTKAQKTAFIELLRLYYPDLQIEESHFPLTRNLVIGDTNTASVVVSAHYDTCAKLPFPNFLAPKNIFITLLYCLTIAIPFLVLMVLIQEILFLIWGYQPFHFSIAYAIVLTLLIWISMFGKPNEHTANDNTSGVIALCELLERLTPKQRKETAIVFFDNEEYGLLGSGSFRKLHKNRLKDCLLINLDCISDGDHILLALSKSARHQYGTLIKSSFEDSDHKRFYFEKSSSVLYPSDHIYFPMHIGISALKKKRWIGLYMDKIHTKHDTNFDEKNIECICNGIQTLIEKAVNAP